MIKRLIQKTLDASKTAFAWRLEDLSPPAKQLLFTFNSENDLKQWAPYSDKEHGGLSTASFSLNQGTGDVASFTGELSTELPDDSSSRLKRSGFAGIRTAVGGPVFDLDPYDTLAFKVRGDGRIYVSSLRTDNWVGGPSGSENNTWQAFVFAPKDEWAVVKIPLRRYLLTWEGKVVDTRIEMNRSKVVGFGFSLAAGSGVGPKEAVQGPGQFRLDIGHIEGLRTGR